MTGRKTTWIYYILQILYWSESSIVFVYCGAFLQQCGLNNAQIGAFLAAANILCFILSNVLAVVIDRRSVLYSASASILLQAGGIALSLGLILFKKHALVTGGLYMLLISCFLSAGTIYNKLYTDIRINGAEINFARARGAGSLSFALTSLLLAFAVPRSSVRIILYLAVAVSAVQLFLLLSIKPLVSGGGEDASADQGSGDMFSFLRKNTGFALLLLGLILVFAANSALNNFYYLVIENINGPPSGLGTVNFVLALLELLVMIWYGRRSRKNTFRPLAVSLLFFPAKMLAIALARNMPELYAANILHAISFGLYTPVIVDYVNEYIPFSDSAKGHSLTGSSVQLGAFLSTVAFGFLFDQLPVKSCLLILSSLAAVGVPIGLFGIRKQTKKSG